MQKIYIIQSKSEVVQWKEKRIFSQFFSVDLGKKKSEAVEKKIQFKFDSIAN